MTGPILPESDLPDPPPGVGITREQRERSRRAWREAASGAGRDLLDAEPVGEEGFDDAT